MGNCHYWGNMEVIQEAALASSKVILIAEELVKTSVITSDPNPDTFPGFQVEAVCHLSCAIHPLPLTGIWKRDHGFFNDYHRLSRNRDCFMEWLEEWFLNP